MSAEDQDQPEAPRRFSVAAARQRAGDAYRKHVVRAIVECARDLSGRMTSGCFV